MRRQTRHRRRRWWLFLFSLLALALLLVNSPWFLRRAYPRHYRQLVEKAAAEAGLDSNLIFAVIKVESNFNPRAESQKGARGLMQLMPATAAWVAAQMRVPVDPARLFEPEYNINLGTWYLRFLYQEFNRDMLLALAAYNGGRGNVEKWLAQRNWSGERATLHQIPFRETRVYVERVLAAYQQYQRLYPP